MSLNDTVSAERVHIGFFGRRNAGKSSLVNAVTGQALSVVSDVRGTTTDPVQKAMELLPVGPVVILDTPGLDDEGELGLLRVEKARQALRKTDVAVLVVDAVLGLQPEDEAFLRQLEAEKKPYLTVFNKADLVASVPENGLAVSASTGQGVHELKEALAALARPLTQQERLLVCDLLRPDLPPERLSPVTAMAGVAVCRAVERLCGVSPGLKWPNDPVLDGKKLCGILTELSLEGETARVQELVLGIGINVSQRPEDFTPEVREIATSLVQALGYAVSRPALAAEIIREVDRLCAALAAGETGPYLAEYRRRCVNLGRTVRLLRPDGGGETAEALDIDEEFGLVVRRPDGAVKTVRSGEVSVRGLYGYTE